MPKDIPPCPDIPKRTHSDLEKTEYTIQIITPLFGGGVEAGEPDPITPIRGTSIRGQLQFWWRATRGARCATLQELLTRHAEIWGTTERASPVGIEVRDVQIKTPEALEKFNEKKQLQYVLFPFQKNSQFIKGGTFTLHIYFPEACREDIEAAVWAWVNFGGLGARTRRGCGALFCDRLAPKIRDDLTNWFKNRTGSTGHQTHEWPTLPENFLYNPKPQKPLDAWKQVVQLLQEFRQGINLGRNSGNQPNRPGRSRWPEPETIRTITNQRSSRHSRIQEIPDDAFPRAELGLPIVFHFQGHGEPPDTTLYPTNGPDDKSFERMASPLILKPLALANDQAIPVIMRLRTLPLANVDLRKGNTTLPLPPTITVRDPRLATYTNSPLKGTQSGSALDAFLALAKKRGFQEVAQ